MGLDSPNHTKSGTSCKSASVARASMLRRIKQYVGRVLAEGVTLRLGLANGGLRLRLNPPYELCVHAEAHAQHAFFAPPTPPRPAPARRPPRSRGAASRARHRNR